jgi:transcriptional regulator with XRE-family HTH domain
MEFHEKLQELRKQKGLTQEELAAALYVSRTAVSKWESGRGYPNIDSLKAIARFFSVTIDALLSGEEVLTIAEEDRKEKDTRTRNVVFGLLDCSSAMFFVLPFFGQKSGEMIQAVSLLSLSGISPWLRAAYFTVVIGMTVWGLLMLGNCPLPRRMRHTLSLGFSAVGALLFIISLQPYAAALLFIFLVIKVLMLGKKL